VVVSNDKCNTCHAQLGAAPTFHAGNRNNAPTCAWCHRPNQTSNGWSANASTFIHGIHGKEARSSDFLWHATCVGTGGYQAPNGTCTSDGTNAGTVIPAKTYGPEVTFPGRLADCEACHVAGSYDFSNADSQAALPNLLSSTVATGTYSAAPAQSPYVDATGVTNYGYGFVFTGYTGAIWEADDSTLVTTPITAACASCHNSPAQIGHMVENGGLFYQPRSVAKTAAAQYAAESCLVCHGTDGIAPIADVHR
jgi:OmcA/MtrC family decaheme c-type cytochrome